MWPRAPANWAGQISDSSTRPSNSPRAEIVFFDIDSSLAGTRAHDFAQGHQYQSAILIQLRRPIHRQFDALPECQSRLGGKQDAAARDIAGPAIPGLDNDPALQ